MRRTIKSLAERRQEEMIAFIKGLLGDRYITIRLGNEIEVKEKFNTVDLKCEVGFSSGKSLVLEGTGSGPVDAMFHAMKIEYSSCYSIKDLILLDFNIRGSLEDDGQPNSKVEAVLVVENNTRHPLAFRSVSRSVLRSSLEVCLKSMEYFINCEEAIKITYACIKDAKKRNRGDIEDQNVLNLQKILKHVQVSELMKSLKNS